MRWMILGLIMLTTATAAVCVADEAAIKAEMSKLEGTWQMVSGLRDGMETPEDTVKKIRVVIKAGKSTTYFGDVIPAKDIPFEIDVTKDPREVTDTLPEGKKIRGIYKVDGDTLTSCVGAVDKDRPAKFESKPGSGQSLRIFKRVK